MESDLADGPMREDTRSYASPVANGQSSDQVSIGDFVRWLRRRPVFRGTWHHLWHKGWLLAVIPAVLLGFASWYVSDYNGWPFPGDFHHIKGPGVPLWHFIAPAVGVGVLMVAFIFLVHLMTARMRAEQAAAATERRLLAAIEDVRSDLTAKINNLERQREDDLKYGGGRPGAPQIGQVSTFVYVAPDPSGAGATQAKILGELLRSSEVTAPPPPDQDDQGAAE